MENNKKTKLIYATIYIILIIILGYNFVPNEWLDMLANKNLEQTKAKTEVYKMGDRVKLGDKIVTAYGVAKYTEPNQFMQPEENNKYMVVDISIENAGTGAISYNTLYFEFQDSNGYIYSRTIVSKEPYFGQGTLQPGRKARGFIVYEVPKNSSGFELIFTSSGLNNGQIIINLGI